MQLINLLILFKFLNLIFFKIVIHHKDFFKYAFFIVIKKRIPCFKKKKFQRVNAMIDYEAYSSICKAIKNCPLYLSHVKFYANITKEHLIFDCR